MKYASMKIDHPSDVLNVLSLLKTFDLNLVPIGDGNEYDQLEKIFNDLTVTVEISDDKPCSALLANMLFATISVPKWKNLHKFVSSFKANECVFIA